MPVPEQYVVVTHYQPPEGKRPVVHVWGPWPTRTKAVSAMRAIQRTDRDDPRADEVTYWVRKILDEHFPPNMEHRYLSTGCLHGDHLYCQAMTGQQGEKRPGRCKFCNAPCICPCHQTL